MNQTSTTQQGLIKHGGLHLRSGRDSLFYSARELDANLFILKIIDMIRWKSKNLR